MMQIINGELRVKLEDKEVLDNGLVPIILKRYEMVLREKAELVFKIQRMDVNGKQKKFEFSEN